MACNAWSWLNQLQKPTLEAFRFIYDANISVEVRNHLANWMKEQLSNTLVYFSNPEEHEPNPSQFLNQLIEKLKQTGSNHSEYIRQETDKSVFILQKLFSNNPHMLYQQLVDCLERQNVAYPHRCVNLAEMDVVEVFEELNRLQILVNKNDIQNGIMKKERDYLDHEMMELQEYQAQLDFSPNKNIRSQMTHEITLCQGKLDDRLHTYWSQRSALFDAFRHVIQITGQLQDKILNNYLSQWKINQRLNGIGASANIESDLDTIQMWCENLAEIIWNTRVQLMQAINTKLERFGNVTEVPDLMPAMKDVTNLYDTLILNSLVVEKQPPQIMKMNARFAVKVRLLVGKKLNITAQKLPHVTVSIISEMHAQKMHCKNQATSCAAGKVVNNIARLEYDRKTEQLSARFNDMRLKKIHRTKKSNDKCVMDGKYALLFQLSLTVKHGESVLPVWGISSPVIVIVHVSQTQQAWANIIWDNAFASVDRIPFQVPEMVCWNWLANILDLKLNGAGGHSLTPYQTHFLCEKALGRDQPFPIPNNVIITWSQFCKKNVPNRGYTFWEWFYQAMKLTQEHFHDLWLRGGIFGFIDRKQAEIHLSHCTPGTFLMRFSDTVLGGITITFVHKGNNDQLKILHIEPFTAKDLTLRTLADRILDYDELSVLYPYIPKHTVFQRQTVQGIVSQDSIYVATDLQARLILPSPYNQSSNESNNIQMPSSNNNQLSYFDLANIQLFS
uniref:Signal transducer and activator of transcription n=1 Tax=Anopheles minimus TaxID=112268 RepID=A0A182W3R6_9DIPT|nr:TPA_inf: signal transducer and activator of transcription B [Anopheles minimus]